MTDSTNTISGDPVLLPDGNLGVGSAAQSGSVALSDGSGHQVNLIAGTSMAGDIQLELPSAYSDATLGTPLLLTDAGQLQTLPDPGGDRLLYWNDVADGTGYLAVGSGLSISGAALNAAGVTIGEAVGGADPYRYLRTDGSGNLAENTALTAGRVPFATTNGLLTDSASITYDGTTLSVNGSKNSGSVLALTNSGTTAASALRGECLGSTGINLAVIGSCDSIDDGSCGVYGESGLAGSGKVYGVCGITVSSDNQAYGGYFDKCRLDSYLDLGAVSTPAAPASGFVRLFESGNVPHYETSAGTSLALASQTGTETLSNKTLTTPIVSGYVDLSAQSSDPATPASGYARLYDKTDKRPYLKDDGGNVHHLARHAQVYHCSQGGDQQAAGDCNLGYKISPYTGGLTSYSPTPPAVTVTNNTTVASSSAALLGNYISAAYTRWSWDPTVAAFPPTLGKQVQVSVGAPLHRPLGSTVKFSVRIRVNDPTYFDFIKLWVGDASGHETSTADIKASLSSNTWATVATSELDISTFDDACCFVLDFAGHPGTDPVTQVDIAYVVLEQWAK